MTSPSALERRSRPGADPVRQHFSIALKIALVSWLVTIATLLVFVAVIVPEQKRTFQENLASKARGLSASLQDVIAGAAVTEDYSSVVDHCRQVLQGDDSIAYIVITKNDGFSLIHESVPGPDPSVRAEPVWRQQTLDSAWHPALREAVSGIGTVPVLDRRVFHYSRPFDYSGIEWGWIHVGLSIRSYDRSVAAVYRRTGILAVGCIAFSLLVSILYARQLVRPILALQTVLQRVSLGDLSARADIHSRDEIESLADSFNTMTGTLLQRDRILEAVRLAAQSFLFSTDWTLVIDEVLTRLGQSTLASRVDVFVADEDSGESLGVNHLFQWVAEGSPAPDRRAGGIQGAPNGPGLLIAETRGSGLISGPVGEMAEVVRELLRPLLIRSTVLAPVMVNGAWWGFLALGECRRDRVWTDPEKDSLRVLADLLGATVARQRSQAELMEAKVTLERRVLDRTSELLEQMAAKENAHADLAEAQHLLMDVSREAGMAEVATGVLHNVGNVLNSVNVSAILIREKLRRSEISTLAELSAMLRLHEDDLAGFLTVDTVGREIPPFLIQLSDHLQEEWAVLQAEQDHLAANIEHIKEVVNMQQNYARVTGCLEQVPVAALVDDALRLNAAMVLRQQIEVVRDYAELEPQMLDKHRVLQILVNLIQNSGHALEASGLDEKRLTLSIQRPEPARLAIAVADNGIGIPAENLTRIFSHGFSTRFGGHGFGLHSGALAAKEMGGTLSVCSDGTGMGALFTLELPIAAAGFERRSER